MITMNYSVHMTLPIHINLYKITVLSVYKVIGMKRGSGKGLNYERGK